MIIKIGKIRINFIYVILIFITSMGLLSGYIEHFQIWRYISLVLFFIVVIFLPKATNIRLYKSWLIAIVFLVGLCLFGSDNGYMKDNFQSLFFPTLLALMLSIILNSYKNKYYCFIERALPLFIAWYFLNVVIVLIQLQGNGFLIKNEWLIYNYAYYDQCCGLFGNSQTANLAMFSIMIVVMTMEYRVKFDKFFIPLLVFEIGLLLFTSVLNDNKSVFIVLPLMLVYYLYMSINKRNISLKNKLLKYLEYIILGVVLFQLIYQISFVQTDVIERLIEIINFKNTTIAGSNERFAIIQYVLDNGKAWKFGYGIGSMGFGKGGNLGFAHFGLNDAGSIIAICGLFFYVMWNVMYSNIFFYSMLKDKNRIQYFVILIYFVVMSLYANPFCSATMVIWFFFTFSLLYRPEHFLGDEAQ